MAWDLSVHSRLSLGLPVLHFVFACFFFSSPKSDPKMRKTLVKTTLLPDFMFQFSQSGADYEIDAVSLASLDTVLWGNWLA